MLSVLLLGPPQVFRDGQSLAIPRRRSRALLYYLAAQTAPVSREHLLAFFWPDEHRYDAQHQLRTSLYALRCALGEALHTSDRQVALADDVRVDLRELEAAVGAPTARLDALDAALQHYRGDFLDSFALDDVPAFAQWLEAERTRWRRLACRGFTCLAELLAARGKHRAALAAVDRALTIDPLQEDVQCAGMRLAYLAGDRVDAIRRFEALRRLLDDELGVPPMDATHTLYDSIITDTLERPPPVSTVRTPHREPEGQRRADASVHPTMGGVLPFVGRHDELAAIREAMQARRLVFVDGAAGTGKTRLVDHALASAGRLVLRAAAYELEQSLPYQPLITALRQLLADPAWPALSADLTLPPVWWHELARLLPELEPAEHPPPPLTDESRLWEAVSQLLAALSTLRPLALVIDDLQWADLRTVTMLGYIARRCVERTPTIALLTTSRTSNPATPAGQLFSVLLRDQLLAHISLSPLSDVDVAALARELSSEPTSLAAWLSARAEGSPFVLTELVRELRARGLLAPDGRFDATLVTGMIVPQTVASLLRARLSRISTAARAMLDVAAIAGPRLAADLALAAALSEEAAADALDELVAAGLLRPAADCDYAFDHSLTQEVVLHDLPPARRRMLHRRVAEALVHNSSRPDGMIAAHFTAAGHPDQAAPHAVRAGERAAGLAAWHEAAEFFEQALAVPWGEQQASLWLRLGEVRYAAGQYARACSAFEQAIARARSAGDGLLLDRARLLLGRAMLPQGRFADAIALAHHVRVDARPELTAQADLLLGTALAQEGYDLAGAQQHLERAAADLERHVPRDLDSLIMAIFESGGIMAQRGELAQAVSAYRRALALAQQGGFGTADQWAVLAYNNLAYHLYLLGDPSARALAEAGLELAQARGMVGLQTYLHSTLGEIALAAADDSAARHADAGLTLARQHGLSERIAGLTALRGRILAQHRDTTGALGELTTALQLANQGGYHYLAAQIQLWRVPLLPADEARVLLAAVRRFASDGNRRRLLDEVERLETALD